MLKEFVWKAFESTGNIDTYVFLKEIEEKFKRIENKAMDKEAVELN